MKCYSVTVGARHTVGRGHRFSRADEEKIIALTQASFPSGFTLLNATGGWFDPVHQRFVREESRQIIVTAAGWSQVRPWSRKLARTLRQKEVLVTEIGRVKRVVVR